jgi:RNA polymerase sigma-70 factor (ECF subfamily)
VTPSPSCGDCTAAATELPALAAVERISRDDSARIVASLIRACAGDFQLAEDVLQEALVAAVQHWPRDGEPRDPVAWIYTTARRKAIDHLRRERTNARTRATLGRLLAAQRHYAAA